MKTIFLILVLAISCAAQSANPKDYVMISKTDEAMHFVDVTSLETVKSGANAGHKVFWGLTVFPNINILFSGEVDCIKRRFRVRESHFFNDKEVLIKKEVGNWVNNDIVRGYINSVCYEDL